MNGPDKEQELRETNLENGLDAQEVQKRLAKYGYNEIPEKKASFLVRLGKRFWGIVPWMLEATAVITFLLGKYPQTLVIVFLLFFNAAMSLWREKRARLAMAALKQRLRIQGRVRRDGKWSIIPARELVSARARSAGGNDVEYDCSNNSDDNGNSRPQTYTID